MKLAIGFLHPGAMGISLAASAQNSGHLAYWASEGRSKATRARAEEHNLLDAGTVQGLCDVCSVVVSICPPHAADAVAEQVLACGFQGLYLDANAISPQRTSRIADRMRKAGARFVDGSIVGGPAWKPKSTWLYMAGEYAADIERCFAAGPLETVILDNVIGHAAALKMCFAAYTKGTTALLAAIVAAAEATGIREALDAQWSRGGSGFAVETAERVQRVTARAWRFAGEMDEIADTFEGAGLPGGFHRSAAEIYRCMASFKNDATPPALEDILRALLKPD